MDYSDCILTDENCGEHRPTRTVGLFSCNELCSGVLPWITERRLIKTHLKYTVKNDSILCAFHRYKYGEYWVAPRQCQHPAHEKESEKRKRKISVEKTSLSNFNRIETIFKGQFSIFGHVCRWHNNLLKHLLMQGMQGMLFLNPQL